MNVTDILRKIALNMQSVWETKVSGTFQFNGVKGNGNGVKYTVSVELGV